VLRSIIRLEERKMALYRTEAIVLRHCNMGEADRIITLLSREYGKIRAVARGVKRPRNRLIGGTQIFTYSEFLIFEGKNLDNISQCEIKESFFKIRDDLEKLTYASYMAELINEFLPEREKNEEVFFLFLKTLHWILKGNDIELIARFFEMKLLLLIGLLPYMESCVYCGGSLEEGEIYFNASMGGAVCSRCFRMGQESMQIERGTLKLMRSLAVIKFEQLALIKTSLNLKQELERVMRSYITYHLEKKLKSLEFLNKVKNKTMT
jgi:DNA repair protein RecO (recombination protein O)